jgi:hypothetical protein
MSESDDIIRFVLSWFLSPFSPSAAASSLLFALWDAPRHSRRAIHSIGKDRFPAAPPAQDVTDGPFDLALPWHGPSLCRPSRQVKRNPGQLRAKPGPFHLDELWSGIADKSGLDQTRTGCGAPGLLWEVCSGAAWPCFDRRLGCAG